MTFGCCFIDGVHFGLEFAALVVGEEWGGFFLPRELDPLRYDGHWVFRAHAVVSIISDQSGLFPSGVMSGAIAVDDTSSLPEFNLEEELVPADSDFAYE